MQRRSLMRHGGSLVGLTVGSSLTPLLRAQPTAGGADISSITFERGGMARGSSKLSLGRSGSAAYSVAGNARAGTPASAGSASLPAGEFDRVAKLLLDKGFFEMPERFTDPTLQDGAWSQISAVRGGREKTVFRREGSGPPALDEIESALDGLTQRLGLDKPAR